MELKKKKQLVKLLMEAIQELCAELHKEEGKDDAYLEERDRLFKGALEEVESMTEDEAVQAALYRSVSMYKAVDNSLFIHKKLKHLKDVMSKGDNPIQGLLKALFDEEMVAEEKTGKKEENPGLALDFLSDIQNSIAMPKFDGEAIDEDESKDK